MEQERTLRVDWKRPNQQPPGGKPVLGPTVIPTVSSPVSFGQYLSEAERFRHIDSSGGSTITGTSRAGIAETESLADDATAIPIHIEPLQMKPREGEAADQPVTENNQTSSEQQKRPVPRRR